MQRFHYTLIFMAGLAYATLSAQSAAQTLTTLASFNGTDGANPDGSVTLSGSTLFGTTASGGAYNEGTVFSVPVIGGAPTVLASFDGTDGEQPLASLTLSADGSTLYGMTGAGGEYGDGTIFSIPLTGGAPTVLASFNGTDGEQPFSSLTLSADGSTLYGTTLQGGPNNDGVIFSIPVTGGAPTVLTSFNGANGSIPLGSLMLSGSVLYGMTDAGGAYAEGNIFSVPITGGPPTILASFNGTDGANPEGSLTLNGSTLYGMTEFGGVGGQGTIFSIPITGGTPATLFSFNGTSGAYPSGSLTLVGSMLYGMTQNGGPNNQGIIFNIPEMGGTPTTLFSFSGTNGIDPTGDLTLSADGSELYGMTRIGGANNDGTVFALTLPASVPEPSSVVLLCFGALGLGAAEVRRRMRRKAS